MLQQKEFLAKTYWDGSLSLFIPHFLHTTFLFSSFCPLSLSLSLSFFPPHSKPFAPLFSLIISPPLLDPVSLCVSLALFVSLHLSSLCFYLSHALSHSIKTIMALISVRIMKQKATILNCSTLSSAIQPALHLSLDACWKMYQTATFLFVFVSVCNERFTTHKWSIGVHTTPLLTTQ